MKYYQATVKTTSEFADTLSVIMIDFGSEGVTVTDYEDVKRVLCEHNWDYADESLLDGISDVYVSGYYPEDYDFSAFTEKLNELRKTGETNVGSLETDLKKIDSADYENEWKKYYVPIELEKTVIVPKWLDCRTDKIKVLIDPGMAFGTGSHETTKLCLRFLERSDIAGKRVADIGCGSGILGATALKLGAKYCLMTDIDEQAVTAAKRNCALNGVESRADVRLGTLPEDARESFSLVLANITADVLISLAAGAANALESGGLMITSGIIHSRAADVCGEYEKYFMRLSAETDGEWQAYLWRKRQ